jgi:hypothetical protein
MKKLIMLALLVSVVGACSGPVYRKPSGTTEEFDETYTDCQTKAGQSRLSTARVFFQASPYERFIDRCMSGKGWKKD